MRAAAIPAAGRYYSPDHQNALPPNVKSIPTRPLSPRPFHPPLTPPTPPAKGPSTTIGQRPADSAHPTRTGYHHQHPHPTLRLHPPSAPNGSTGPRLPHPRPQTGRGNRQNQTKQDDKQTPKSTPGVPATHTNSQQTATLPPNPQNTAPCQPNPHTPSPNRFSRKPPPTTPARQKAPSAAIGQKPADSAHPTRTGYHHQHPHPAPPSPTTPNAPGNCAAYVRRTCACPLQDRKVRIRLIPHAPQTRPAKPSPTQPPSTPTPPKTRRPSLTQHARRLRTTPPCQPNPPPPASGDDWPPSPHSAPSAKRR